MKDGIWTRHCCTCGNVDDLWRTHTCSFPLHIPLGTFFEILRGNHLFSTQIMDYLPVIAQHRTTFLFQSLITVFENQITFAFIFWRFIIVCYASTPILLASIFVTAINNFDDSFASLANSIYAWQCQVVWSATLVRLKYLNYLMDCHSVQTSSPEDESYWLFLQCHQKLDILWFWHYLRGRRNTQPNPNTGRNTTSTDH